MLVSILIPTLNRQAMLARAIESALAQTGSAIEVVVSDDGSTDGTSDYLEALTAREAHVRLVPRNPTPGLFANMNHLLEQRRGDFFCILADDDLLEPKFVERLLDHLSAEPQCVACFCAIVRRDADQRFLGFHAEGLRDDPGLLDGAVRHILDMKLLLSNVLYRTSALGEMRFDLDCLGAAEKDFNLRAHAIGPFFYSPEPLSVNSVHAGQASLARDDFMWRGLLRVLERHRFARPDEDRLRRRSLQQTRVGYASAIASTRPAACLELVASYLCERPSSWAPRELGSLALSTLRATLRSAPSR